MGAEFKQVAGGNDGTPIGQLAADEASGTVTIPLGSVIVTDGHDALFEGVVKVVTTWQLITYDANASSGWTISLMEPFR